MNDTETTFHIVIKFIFIRALYFAGAFIGLVSVSLSSLATKDRPVFRNGSWGFYEGPNYWFYIFGISVAVAMIGPPIYDRYKESRR